MVDPWMLSHMDRKNLLRLVILAVCGVVLTGCETTYLTDHTMDASAQGRNEVKVAVNTNVKAVNHAVEQVCKDLNLNRRSREADMLIARFVYRTPSKEDITIFTRATSAISTDVRIQYDLQGSPRHPQDIITGLRDIKTIQVPVSIIGDAPVVSN